ncbi:hypothetical protein OK016_23240 [Vibrio chagasii]|nr:hypothetical protein [Vibrio chagasii]
MKMTLYDQRYSVISVEDDGEGIPDNKIAGIFDPFTRIESSKRQTGLVTWSGPCHRSNGCDEWSSGDQENRESGGRGDPE